MTPVMVLGVQVSGLGLTGKFCVTAVGSPSVNNRIALSAPGWLSVASASYACHKPCDMLVYPLHVRGVRTLPIWVLNVVDSGLSIRELVAKVTSPILSLPSENRSTNNFAAAFSISHA